VVGIAEWQKKNRFVLLLTGLRDFDLRSIFILLIKQSDHKHLDSTHIYVKPSARFRRTKQVLLCLALECFLIARKRKAGLSQYSKPHPCHSYFPHVWNSDPGTALNDHPPYIVGHIRHHTWSTIPCFLIG